MKFLTKYENIEAYSNEAFRLPYPNISLVKGLPNKKSFYREEPSWVKCVYEIPSEAFESTSAVTVLNSVPGYINDYKINGVYGEVEQLRVEEGVEVEVFQSYTMEGMQVYLPTTDACFLIPNLSTETEFTLSRPLNETDIMVQIIYNGSNELVDLQLGGMVGDLGEYINIIFSFRSDTIYTYSDYFLEAIKEQASDYEGMKLGFFFVNSEWYDNPLEAPSLNTTMIGNAVRGGVQKVEVLPSMLDENNKVVIEYGLSEHDNTINSTFRNIDYLKEIDFTRLKQKINSARSFKIKSEAFVDCSVLENVKLGDYIISIGDYAFDGCISLPVYDNAYYADTYCVGAVNTGITSCTIKEGTKWIGKEAFLNCKGLTSVVISDSVISIGEDTFRNCSGLTSLEIGSGVTSIGGYAFLNCSGLTSMVIPDSVTSIGNYAFSGCTSLKKITCHAVTAPSISGYTFYNVSTFGKLIYPEGSDYSSWLNTNSYYLGYYAWNETPVTVTCTYNVTTTGSSTMIAYDTTGIVSIKVDGIVKTVSKYPQFDTIGSHNVEINYRNEIANNAFSGCTNLTSVEIGSGVTTIGQNVFRDCTGLTSVAIPDSVTGIGNSAFSGCSGLTGVLIIPDSVTSISDSAFKGCRYLTSVEIGSGVTSIGEWAFDNCDRLTSLVIPDSVTSIGRGAFNGCSRLKSIEIGSGVTSIGSQVFYYCSELESFIVSTKNTTYDSRENCNCIIETSTNTLIHGSNNSFIPDSVTSIGDYAFYYCSGLTGEFIIPDSVTSIGKSTFSGCSGLTGELIIPDSVTSIGEYAFSECKGLTSVVIPDSVTSIDNGIFHGCTGLTGEFIIPDSVTSIGNWVFYNCSGLTSIVIPNSVTSIGRYAFYKCSGLPSIVIPNSVKSIGSEAFYQCSGLTEITCHATTAPSISSDTFESIKTGGILYVPAGSDYSSWMSTSSYYLGKYGWKLQYIS